MTENGPQHNEGPGGASAPLFHVVLVRPEIPNNTGNIGRTCVATGCALHLVRPLGFDVSEKACRRAGLDYWPRLTVTEHDSWEAYEAAPASPRAWYFTTKATVPYTDVPIQRGDALIFGSETSGLPQPLVAGNAARAVTLPMVPGERSLNLATAVSIVVYEGLRQLRAAGVVDIDASGRLRISKSP